MASRKIIIYQRYATKPVILTDNSDRTKEEIQKDILNVLKSDKIAILETATDSVVIRPSEIQAILISNQTDQEIPDNDKKHKSNYDKKLTLEEPK